MLIGALVVPAQIGTLPLFLMLKSVGLVNTYAGALVPWLASIFGIFLVRQYALSHSRTRCWRPRGSTGRRRGGSSARWCCRP
jgi:ABC-type glycerol-3-phosphate transport system permease component